VRLPVDEGVEHRVGKTERAEEPEAFTALHASAARVTCVCQLCVKSRRTR
jgi:hypothetical protein